VAPLPLVAAGAMPGRPVASRPAAPPGHLDSTNCTKSCSRAMVAPAAGTASTAAGAGAGAAAAAACCCCCCCWGSRALHMRGLVSAGTASMPAYCLTAAMGVALGCSSGSQDSAAAALKLATAGQASLLQGVGRGGVG
jgi:hypothetical protein